MLAKRVTISYPIALVALIGLTLGAFAYSYGQLAPLAGSESPESVLLLIPLAAFVLIGRALFDVAPRSDEAAINAVFAAPLLVVLAALMIWLPAKLSYFYWVYRLDLLAVPFFVGGAIIMLFGIPAFWRARSGIAVLLLGWPPLLDSLIREVSDPLAHTTAQITATAVAPISNVRTIGESFVFPNG